MNCRCLPRDHAKRIIPSFYVVQWDLSFHIQRLRYIIPVTVKEHCASPL